MPVLVDTSILSLALRRRRVDRLSLRERGIIEQFVEMTDAGEARLIGMIRQEVLSGLRHREQFVRLHNVLEGFDYLPVELADHDAAAECFNTCQSNGIAGGDVDMLIVAVAIRHGVPVFTTDADFARYQSCLPFHLHQPIP